MFRRARRTSTLSSTIAFALSVAIFAIVPSVQATGVPRGLSAAPVDRDAPACPDDSRGDRDTDDGDEDDLDDDSFVRLAAHRTSGPPPFESRPRDLDATRTRRGHRTIPERPPRA
ncbi:MAG: hypothetical protein KC619_08855 [Myxococcales bacterium]|nr:hypothetical protein [Myxococcales bacterium]